MLKLYHQWTSTCSKRVRITLAEKNLDWESHHISLKDLEHLDEWYVKLNPEGVVPTLDHDGNILTESNFIIEYLDEMFPDFEKHFISKDAMNIEGLGKKVVENFWELRFIKLPQDIYNLDYTEHDITHDSFFYNLNKNHYLHLEVVMVH